MSHVIHVWSHACGVSVTKSQRAKTREPNIERRSKHSAPLGTPRSDDPIFLQQFAIYSYWFTSFSNGQSFWIGLMYTASLVLTFATRTRPSGPGKVSRTRPRFQRPRGMLSSTNRSRTLGFELVRALSHLPLVCRVGKYSLCHLFQ